LLAPKQCRDISAIHICLRQKWYYTNRLK